LSLSRGELETWYRKESRVALKERLLLILKVEGDGMIPAHVAKELYRSRTWTCDWLARYRKKVLTDYRIGLRVVGLPNYLEKLLLM
jgi:hypothetical protein